MVCGGRRARGHGAEVLARGPASGRAPGPGLLLRGAGLPARPAG